MPMSSIDACLADISQANERILAQPVERRRAHIVERTVSVVVPDLATVFDMRLTVDGLTDITQRSADSEAPEPQVRVTVSSSDLADLAADRLAPARAVLTRRLRVHASISDMLRLRRVL